MLLSGLIAVIVVLPMLCSSVGGCGYSQIKPTIVIKPLAEFLCRGLEDDYDKAYNIYTLVCKNIAFNRDHEVKSSLITYTHGVPPVHVQIAHVFKSDGMRAA